MGVAYSIADLVVSRAGAISISELAVLGKASILIPSPNVAEDHQTKNAMALADGKASLVLNDKEAVEKLIPMVLNTINSDHVLNELSKNIENFARPESTSEIVKEVEKLIQTK
jgi:UDP-N-acetylglucosamine--N-acetylmuramyl-(pentapeptide) pyrophosphoryl-undecaprenol N-acetylglucosamine transferase